MAPRNSKCKCIHFELGDKLRVCRNDVSTSHVPFCSEPHQREFMTGIAALSKKDSRFAEGYRDYVASLCHYLHFKDTVARADELRQICDACLDLRKNVYGRMASKGTRTVFYPEKSVVKYSLERPNMKRERLEDAVPGTVLKIKLPRKDV
jgi:hypothetical protein